MRRHPTIHEMTEPVAVAVIGAGGWGKNLVRNFAALKRARLSWVCDLSEPARLQAAAAHPGLQCTESYREVLEDDDVRDGLYEAFAGAELLLRGLEPDRWALVTANLRRRVDGTDPVRVAA